jgi:hypothetical protein
MRDSTVLDTCGHLNFGHVHNLLSAMSRQLTTISQSCLVDVDAELQYVRSQHSSSLFCRLPHSLYDQSA